MLALLLPAWVPLRVVADRLWYTDSSITRRAYARSSDSRRPGTPARFAHQAPRRLGEAEHVRQVRLRHPPSRPRPHRLPDLLPRRRGPRPGVLGVQGRHDQLTVTVGENPVPNRSQDPPQPVVHLLIRSRVQGAIADHSTPEGTRRSGGLSRGVRPDPWPLLASPLASPRLARQVVGMPCLVAWRASRSSRRALNMNRTSTATTMTTPTQPRTGFGHASCWAIHANVARATMLTGAATKIVTVVRRLVQAFGARSARLHSWYPVTPSTAAMRPGAIASCGSPVMSRSTAAGTRITSAIPWPVLEVFTCGC